MSSRALLGALPLVCLLCALVSVACFGSSQEPGPDGLDASAGIDASAGDDASNPNVGHGAMADARTGEAGAEEGAVDAAADTEPADVDADADVSRADAEGGAVDAGSTDATSPRVDAAPGGFSCGPMTCDSATEICSIVNGHLPSQAATYECVLSEGGPPSCSGAPSAVSPGSCGCYESPAGEVTSTLCPP